MVNVIRASWAPRHRSFTFSLDIRGAPCHDDHCLGTGRGIWPWPRGGMRHPPPASGGESSRPRKRSVPGRIRPRGSGLDGDDEGGGAHGVCVAVGVRSRAQVERYAGARAAGRTAPQAASLAPRRAGGRARPGGGSGPLPCAARCGEASRSRPAKVILAGVRTLPLPPEMNEEPAEVL